MISKEVVSKILWATVEDYVGLWEILWELNTNETDNLNKRKTIILGVLKYLLENQLINFYTSIWGEENINELSKEKIISYLNKDIYWNPPSVGEECLKIGSTKKGENYYYKDLLPETIDL